MKTTIDKMQREAWFNKEQNKNSGAGFNGTEAFLSEHRKQTNDTKENNDILRCRC